MMFVSMEFKIIQICFTIQCVTNKDQWNYNNKLFSFVFGNLANFCYQVMLTIDFNKHVHDINVFINDKSRTSLLTANFQTEACKIKLSHNFWHSSSLMT
jgi:hypothetical protein